jgi:hypothetical protein
MNSRSGILVHAVISDTLEAEQEGSLSEANLDQCVSPRLKTN